MAQNTGMDENIYPCEAVPVEELDEIVFDLSINLQPNMRRLKHGTYNIATKYIPWGNLRHLHILGTEYEQCNDCILSSGLTPGAYINRHGDWLLLICLKDSFIQTILECCDTTLEHLSIYNTGITNLALDRLTNLNSLTARKNTSLETISGLEALTLLTEINLSYCTCLSTLSELDNLMLLRHLNLTGCENLIELQETAGLPALTFVNVSMCQSLTRLDLSGCKNLHRIAGLNTLYSLSMLDLSGCAHLTAIDPLDELENLAQLHLDGCTSLTALSLIGSANLMFVSGIETLTNLRNLYFALENPLILPDLERLTRLTELRIRDCEILTSLPELGNLRQLTVLDLAYCENLTTLTGIANLKNLTTLNLAGCISLTSIPELAQLPQLVELDLSSCENIRELPEGIRHMKSLKRLDISYLSLNELPDWLPEIAEQFMTSSMRTAGHTKAIVYLEGTSVDNVDMSIFEQPYTMVVTWFGERKMGRTQPLNEIKVVFLGDGEAGKSLTIARLRNNGGDPVGYVDVRTPGIVIDHVKYPIGAEDATLHLWDFGGQEILHSMHRIFLTERTVYVVVVDGRIGNQDERARYWLHNIQSFAKDAPVLLVLNKLDDGLQADVNATDLYHKYTGLKRIIKFSALKYTRQEFNQIFTDVLLEEIAKTGFLTVPWPSNWFQVKRELEKKSTEYVMTGSRYQQICRDCGVDSNQKELLHWFNDLGVSFCCYDDYKLDNYVILKPDWITNALYIILFNEREGAIGGLVPHRTIYTMLSPKAHNKDRIERVLRNVFYEGYDVQYVLDVIRKFKLSFRKNDEYEFIPMLADRNAKPVAAEYAHDENALEFYMEFDYLPNNVLHNLMVDRQQELDMDNVWLTGARFQLPDTGLSAVLSIDGNILRFFIRHGNNMHRPNTYLTMLKANVDRIWDRLGLKAPRNWVVYKMEGKAEAFDYNRLKLSLELEQKSEISQVWQRLLPITDILNQFAPDDLENEKRLLDALKRSCKNIQAEPDYRLNGNGRGMEDKRNRRIRDDLFGWGYNIQDQSQRGLSGTGNSIGELDLLLHNDKREPWTAIEALRVSRTATTEWNKHLNKLLGNYNYFGAPFLFLLTYVDAPPDVFAEIWEGYQTHIKEYDPEHFTYLVNSFVELNDSNDPKYIKVAKCRYVCADERTTVYHIFVRISTQSE